MVFHFKNKILSLWNKWTVINEITASAWIKPQPSDTALFVLLSSYTSKARWKITRYNNLLVRFEGRMVVRMKIIVWQREVGRWIPTFWSNLQGRKPTQENKNSADNVEITVSAASFFTLISLLPSSCCWFTAPVFRSHTSVEYFSMFSLLLKYLKNTFLHLV